MQLFKERKKKDSVMMTESFWLGFVFAIKTHHNSAGRAGKDPCPSVRLVFRRLVDLECITGIGARSLKVLVR
jgi:hypothetical protein